MVSRNSKLGIFLTEKYADMSDYELRKVVGDNPSCPYRFLRTAERDRLILAMELTRWPSDEEYETAVAEGRRKQGQTELYPKKIEKIYIQRELKLWR